MYKVIYKVSIGNIFIYAMMWIITILSCRKVCESSVNGPRCRWRYFPIIYSDSDWQTVGSWWNASFWFCWEFWLFWHWSRHRRFNETIITETGYNLLLDIYTIQQGICHVWYSATIIISILHPFNICKRERDEWFTWYLWLYFENVLINSGSKQAAVTLI